MKVHILLAAVIHTAMASFCAADTWYVSPSSLHDGPGTNWVTAFHTIQPAISQAASNDTVVVSNGIYYTSNEIILSRPVTLEGAGAVIDAGGSGDRIFSISSQVDITGMVLTGGRGLFGGAISIKPSGSLRMKRCSISDSIAGLWGGAIDVEQGRLILEECSIYNNSTDLSSGMGGGGISLWTDQHCAFTNTTFSGNSQRAPAGYGGGALYVENFTPAVYLYVDIVHCTFVENLDEALVASSVYANGYGTAVQPLNSIFSDGLGYNLGIAGGAEEFFQSLGGNISDDAAQTLIRQGNQMQIVYLLDAASDQIHVNPRISIPGLISDNAVTYPLFLDSPAVSNAVGAVVVIDQRGEVRGDAPDSGACEYDAALVDSDGDGLIDADEGALGTDPLNSDTDGDGFDDNFEVIHGYSPTTSDAVMTDYVRNNQGVFGLYTTNALLDVAVGQMAIAVSNGNANLWLQLLQSDDLVTWTNAGSPSYWSHPVEGDKYFFKVRAAPE